jgi:hypothetical protein
MLEQAATIYISIVVLASTILGGMSLYAASMGDGNVPGGAGTSKQYQGLGLVLGSLSIWGLLILFC